jgi:hypothetical protein
VKALTPDQAGDRRDDVEPLVLRGIEIDGEIRIVPVPEDRDLDVEELKQLARWRANQPPQGRESGGAVRERSERTPSECPERGERRSRRKRGLAPDPEARPHRGTGGTDLDKRCGVEAVAVAVYILHLRESTPRSEVNHRERRLAGDSL